MAVFPNGIKQFRNHRNLTDDVDAADINAIQDEIVAIERYLGANPDDTVSQRLATLEKQRSGHMFEMVAAPNESLVASMVNLAVPQTVAFGRPSDAADPSGVYDGQGATIPVDGFWLLSGSVDVQSQSDHSGPHPGAAGPVSMLWSGIVLDGQDWSSGAHVVEEATHYATGHHHILNPTRLGWLPAGTRVTLGISQSTGHPQRLVRARLSGICLTER